MYLQPTLHPDIVELFQKTLTFSLFGISCFKKPFFRLCGFGPSQSVQTLYRHCKAKTPFNQVFLDICRKTEWVARLKILTRYWNNWAIFSYELMRSSLSSPLELNSFLIEKQAVVHWGREQTANARMNHPAALWLTSALWTEACRLVWLLSWNSNETLIIPY